PKAEKTPERFAFAIVRSNWQQRTYAPQTLQQNNIITTMAGPGQSRGKGKALESIAARSGRDPAAIIDSIQAAEKAQAKAEAAKQRAAKVEASKKAAAKAASKKSVGVGKGLNNNNNNKHDSTDDDEDDAATKDHNEVNYPSQIYSSLSPQEQYRFQCYRRSGFASKPIEKFVAKMLVDEANRRFVARRGTMVGLGGRSQVNSGSSANNGHSINGEDEAAAATVTDIDHHQIHSNNKKRKKPSKRQMLQEESKRRRVAMDQPPPYLLNSFNNGTGSSGSAGSSGLNSSSTARGGGGGVVVPPLDQLVVPNSASEIVAVVSTLAKCYAQRLVSARGGLRMLSKNRNNF
ncbi:hypothetical protein QTG54_007031, partial [Skeletonema marinoi]